MSKQITEEQSIQFINYAKEQEFLYTILSIRQGNYISGVSIPYVCFIPEQNLKGIVVFTKEEYARAFVENNRFEILDGIYPIGKFDPKDEVRGLDNLVTISNGLGLDYLDINPGTGDHELGCNLSWYLEANKVNKDLSMLISKEQYESMINDKGQVMLQFNPIRYIDFDDSYIMNQEKSNLLLQKVFNIETASKSHDVFREFSLFELCHVSQRIGAQILPKAKELNNDNDVMFFMNVMNVIVSVAIEKLNNRDKVFTLTDEKGEILVRDGCAYILYTDRFKYMGRYNYVEIPTGDVVGHMKKITGLSQFVVTDGPHEMILLYEGKES